MLLALLPHYTYRRLAVRLAYHALRGHDPLRNHLNRENFAHYRRFGRCTLHCNVCGARGRPLFDFPDLKLRRDHRIGELRETLQCQRCGATMRHRTLVSALLAQVSKALDRRFATVEELAGHGLGGLEILDTDAFSPTSKRLRGRAGYTMSSYVPDRPMGALLATGHHNIDLERIDFPDGRFDVVLTSDVMEHVRDIDAAHGEIARVLRLGGHYVFTVPYDPACPTHHVLVDTSGAEDRFVVPPQYHGDPLTGGVLAYRVFGRGLFDDLRRVGLDPTFDSIDDAEALIVNGDVFVATKETGRA